MKSTFKFLLVALAPFLLAACSQPETSTPEATTPIVAQEEELVEEVMTPEEQRKMTPDQVIESFMEGNKRFMNNDLTQRDHKEQVRRTADGQFPKAVVLSCLDSRIPVEDVFDKGIGDIFVARVAGNFVNPDILGSMEFGCKVAGSKVIMVMGHESCGAVKAAIDDVKLGNITEMLTKITPAVAKSQDFDGEKNSKNSKFVSHVSSNNVLKTIDDIRTGSPILKEMEDNGEIKIVGAIYNMKSGKVSILN